MEEREKEGEEVDEEGRGGEGGGGFAEEGCADYVRLLANPFPLELSRLLVWVCR